MDACGRSGDKYTFCELREPGLASEAIESVGPDIYVIIWGILDS